MGGKGSGGHNRKPIEDHHRDGTFRKDRHSKFLLAEWNTRIDQTMPVCPDWFDDIARAEWNRVAPELHKAGLLTVLDHACLEGYCFSYSMFVRASKELGDGLIYNYIETKSLKMKRTKKPEVKIANDAMNLMRLFVREFGLSSDHGRMVLPGKEGTDPFEKMLDNI